MSIVVKGTTGTSFTPHPEGQFNARCIDVVDLGWMPGSQMYPDPKYKIRLVFFCGLRTDEKEFEGELKTYPMLVMATFTASLGDKANLRKFARNWRGGIDFTADEIRGGFDFERMLDAGALLQIEHNTKGENTYANIGSVMKLAPGQTAPETPADYTRVCKREAWPGPNPHPDLGSPNNSTPLAEAPPMTEPADDLPFRLAS